LRKAPSLRNNNGSVQLRVRIDCKDHFINRLGRWDDPAAVAKAQALSAKIWSDYQSGEFDPTLRIYQPHVKGNDVALLERLRINAETRRQKRAIHAYRVAKRYGKPLRSLTDTQAFIKWAQDDQKLSERTIVGVICEFKRACPESKHLFKHNLKYKRKDPAICLPLQSGSCAFAHFMPALLAAFLCSLMPVNPDISRCPQVASMPLSLVELPFYINLKEESRKFFFNLLPVSAFFQPEFLDQFLSYSYFGRHG
jgi:hypothetical protein